MNDLAWSPDTMQYIKNHKTPKPFVGNFFRTQLMTIK